MSPTPSACDESMPAGQETQRMMAMSIFVASVVNMSSDGAYKRARLVQSNVAERFSRVPACCEAPSPLPTHAAWTHRLCDVQGLRRIP
jgi:hypothetical protein